MAKVIVAMSGGVDSSVAAVRLQEQGHEVLGVTMKLLDLPESLAEERTCCSLEAVRRAQAVCHRLEIPHYTLNFVGVFVQEVIGPFVAQYRTGGTPNPCLRCNMVVKWGELLRRARGLGCEYLATGHYTRLEQRGERWCLRRGADRDKDQSYALYGLSQEALAHTLLPLGEMTKQQVRELAAELELPTAETRESQDICFIPAGDYRAFLRDKIPFEPGPIVDVQGRAVGEHEGLPAYTVGQRRGLGLGGGEPLFVLALDVANNRLVVGPRVALPRREAIIEDLNWVCQEPLLPGESLATEVELRYRGEPIQAEITVQNGGRAHLRLAVHSQAVTPGQAAVFYDRDRLLGGGIIAKEEVAVTEADE